MDNLSRLSWLLIGTLCLVIAAGCDKQSASDDLVLSNLQLEFLDSFESSVSSFEGFLVHPVSCEFAEDGRLFVLDSREQHIVVFNDTYRVIDIIGREGDGPGEFRFTRQTSNTNRIDISGSLLAVDSERDVHLFRTDGTFINRFQTGEQIEDLALTPEGQIITFSNSTEASFCLNDSTGLQIQRFGSPFVTVDTLIALSDDWRLRTRNYNLSEIECLPSGRLVSLGLHWPRIQVFANANLIAESNINYSRLFPDASPELSRDIAILDNRWETFSPTLFNELASTGRLTESHLTGPGRLLVRFNVVGSNLWGAAGTRLFQFSESGTILRVFEIDEYSPWNLAIHHDGRIALCVSNSRQSGLAVGVLPSGISDY